MYHIKNDKRCIRSADTVVDALERLIETKDYNNITISDIQRESMVGRSTFYRLFDTIDDVVLYRVDQMMDELLVDYKEMSNHEFVKEYLKLIVNRGGIWLKVVGSGRTDKRTSVNSPRSYLTISTLALSLKGLNSTSLLAICNGNFGCQACVVEDKFYV